MDKQWWELNGAEVQRDFVGDRFTNNPVPMATRIESLKHFGNSGAGAIALAIAGGVSRVVMVGYDCQHTDGKRHWHADYPAGMGNAGMVHKWHDKFAELALFAKDKCSILNASRETALTCFQRVTLEDALCQK